LQRRMQEARIRYDYNDELGNYEYRLPFSEVLQLWENILSPVVEYCYHVLDSPLLALEKIFMDIPIDYSIRQQLIYKWGLDALATQYFA
ncbi:MAG TPA: hypothetical protein DCR93_35030, partial [Cytophagales bacterium]|nr:hypothetical protein [Cytophagales bacterium]